MLVDTGASLLVVPRPVADELELPVVRTQSVQTAGGRREAWPVSEVRLGVDGNEVTTPCFIAPGGPARLGAVALRISSWPLIQSRRPGARGGLRRLIAATGLAYQITLTSPESWISPSRERSGRASRRAAAQIKLEGIAIRTSGVGLEDLIGRQVQGLIGGIAEEIGDRTERVVASGRPGLP